MKGRIGHDIRDKKLVNQWAADHTCCLAGASPILVLDMYEHSYHMDYGAKAAAYVDALHDQHQLGKRFSSLLQPYRHLELAVLATENTAQTWRRKTTISRGTGRTLPLVS
jgi:hypothetical protein